MQWQKNRIYPTAAASNRGGVRPNIGIGWIGTAGGDAQTTTAAGQPGGDGRECARIGTTLYGTGSGVHAPLAGNRVGADGEQRGDSHVAAAV